MAATIEQLQAKLELHRVLVQETEAMQDPRSDVRDAYLSCCVVIRTMWPHRDDPQTRKQLRTVVKLAKITKLLKERTL